MKREAVADDGNGDGKVAPTVQGVRECIMEVIEDQDGEPPSVKAVRHKITDSYKELGRSKKEAGTLIKEVGFCFF